MTKTVEYIFDFGAPNGYLAWYPLKDITARTGALLTVTPVFLGGMHRLTGNSPPMTRDANVKGKVPYATLEFYRFLDRHGMDRFRIHPELPFNSILPQRILVAAKDEPERQAIVEALLPAIWEQNIDCCDADPVGAALHGAGLDATRLIDGSQKSEIKAKLAEHTERAVMRGAFGVPTFFVGDEMWFGKERLSQLEEFLRGGKP